MVPEAFQLSKMCGLGSECWLGLCYLIKQFCFYLSMGY